MILNEYADEKAGGKSAGAYQQYKGRLGKVDLCQVAVALGYSNWKLEPWPLWTMAEIPNLKMLHQYCVINALRSETISEVSNP